MVCEHLQQLYQLCADQELRLSGSDLIRVVCTQCGQQEVCPSTLVTSIDDLPDESRSSGVDASEASA